MSSVKTKDGFFSGLIRDASAPVEFASILLISYIFTFFLPLELRIKMGIIPRSPEGLLGIPLHPFLHFNNAHLICNIIAIIILGWLISLRSRKTFLIITSTSWILGGIILWIIGRKNGVAGGASGIVYGYIGFLMLRGLFDRNLLSIALSLITIYYFHRQLIGMLPVRSYISWEGHISGFIVGVLCAYYLSKTSGKRARRKRFLKKK